MTKKSRASIFREIASELNTPEDILRRISSPEPSLVTSNEIERILSQHPAVKDVALIEGQDSNSLTACVVAHFRNSPRIKDRLRYRLPNNMAILSFNYYESDYLYKEIFESNAYLRHGIEIRDDALIFDVGANIGLFTLFVQNTFTNTHVFAFEPCLRACELLRVNATLYGSDVKILDYGLSNSPKRAVFTFFPAAAGSSGFYPTMGGELLDSVVKKLAISPPFSKEIEAEISQNETFLSELRTLSSVFAEYSIETIDLLKIDVEGSELDVLLGINIEDWAKIRQMVLEVHGQALLNEIMALLQKMDFDFVVDRNPSISEGDFYLVYSVNKSTGLHLIKEDARKIPSNVRSISYNLPVTKGDLFEFFGRSAKKNVHFDIVFVENIPRVRGAQVDYEALSVLIQGIEDGTVFRAPCSAVEQKLADIWRELTGVKHVGVDDNFFDLGGHSILAMQMLSRVRDEFRIELPLAAFFSDQPVLANLAKTIHVELASEMRREELDSSR